MLSPTLSELFSEAREEALRHVARLEQQLHQAESHGAARDAPDAFGDAAASVAVLKDIAMGDSYEDIRRVSTRVPEVLEEINKAQDLARQVQAERKRRKAEERRKRIAYIVTSPFRLLGALLVGAFCAGIGALAGLIAAAVVWPFTMSESSNGVWYGQEFAIGGALVVGGIGFFLALLLFSQD